MEWPERIASIVWIVRMQHSLLSGRGSLPLLHHGMMLMGVPYDVPELLGTETGGTPYGASHVAGSSNSSTLSKDEIKICQSVGKRLTQVASKLK